MKEDKLMFDGMFYEFRKDQLSDLSALGSQGFEFDWDSQTDPLSQTVGYLYQGKILSMVEYVPITSSLYNEIALLEVSTKHRNMGLAGLMLAYVAKDSFDRGFEGFMLVVSKTALRRFYVDKMGGERIGNTNRIRFTAESSKKLIERYGKDHEHFR